jgi:WD40 repeat protein
MPFLSQRKWLHLHRLGTPNHTSWPTRTKANLTTAPVNAHRTSHRAKSAPPRSGHFLLRPLSRASGGVQYRTAHCNLILPWVDRLSFRLAKLVNVCHSARVRTSFHIMSTLPPPQPSYIFRGHTSQIHSVQIVRQNTRLVTGDADGWVVCWKLESKRPVAVWRAHDASILGTAEWGSDKVIT